MKNSVKITWIAGISTIIAALISSYSGIFSNQEKKSINIKETKNSSIIIGNGNEIKK